MRLVRIESNNTVLYIDPEKVLCLLASADRQSTTIQFSGYHVMVDKPIAQMVAMLTREGRE